MSPAAKGKLDEAVINLLGFAAVLDIVGSDMARNAEASEPINGIAACPEYRVHLMTPMQARAFDFALTMVVDAAEDVRKAYEALD